MVDPNLVQLPGIYRLNEQRVDEPDYLQISLSGLRNIGWAGMSFVHDRLGVDLLPQYTGQLCIKYEQSGMNGVTLTIEYQPPGDTAYYWDIYPGIVLSSLFLTITTCSGIS